MVRDSKAAPAVRQNATPLITIQYLRAIAALLVTIAHASEEAKYFFGFRPMFETESFGKGVDIFFVISGFIIYYSSFNSLSDHSFWKKFCLNRAIRVIPLYYLATTLMVLVVALLPSGVKEAKLDWNQVITSYLFIPYERYDGRIAPILSLGWTLNYEIFFYAIFSFFLFLNRKYSSVMSISFIIFLAILGSILPGNLGAPVKFWTGNIILEFGMGIAIGMAMRRFGKIAFPQPLAILLILFGFISIYYFNTPPKPVSLPRFLAAGLPAALIVFSAVLLISDRSEKGLPRVGAALGDSSYSLYLTHRFVQRPIQMAFSSKPLESMPYSGLTYLIVAVLCAVGVGHLVYKVLEKPLLKLLKARLARDFNTASKPEET